MLLILLWKHLINVLVQLNKKSSLKDYKKHNNFYCSINMNEFIFFGSVGRHIVYIVAIVNESCSKLNRKGKLKKEHWQV
jgi:hypothetical protein